MRKVDSWLDCPCVEGLVVPAQLVWPFSVLLREQTEKAYVVAAVLAPRLPCIDFAYNSTCPVFSEE